MKSNQIPGRSYNRQYVRKGNRDIGIVKDKTALTAYGKIIELSFVGWRKEYERTEELF